MHSRNVTAGQLKVSPLRRHSSAVTSRHCWFTAISTRHQLFSTSGTQGVVLIILLAGGEQTVVYVLPQRHNFKPSMASSELIHAGRKLTGQPTGVRSAVIAAITSCHSLYWPPPIGILLKVLHTQTSLLSGTKKPWCRDKENIWRVTKQYYFFSSPTRRRFSGVTGVLNDVGKWKALPLKKKKGFYWVAIKKKNRQY